MSEKETVGEKTADVVEVDPGAQQTIALAEWNLRRRKFVDQVVMGSSVLLGLAYFSSLFFVFVRSPNENYLLVKVFFGQFPITVGLPAAAAMAFFVVWALEATVGRMEIKLGEVVNFRGAATPTLFWIACFLAIGYMVKLNWITI